MIGPKRNLTQQDFKRSQKLYFGKLKSSFYFESQEIFELENGEFFIRQDFHLIPLAGFFPEVEIFNIDGKLVLIYIKNWYYTYIEPIKVINTQLVMPFEGFEYSRRYRLQNEQIWQQISYGSTNMSSSGSVKIIRDRFMQVDNWNLTIEVENVTTNTPFNTLWTKKYTATHAGGLFQIILSKQINSSFSGTVLFHIKKGDWTENNAELILQNENFTSWDEKQLYENCIQWAEKNIANQFSVGAPEITDYQ